MFSLTDAKKYV